MHQRAVGLTLCSLLAIVALAGIWPGWASAQVQPRIDWRIENPFRFLVDPADTEIHRATWLSLTADERRKPILAAERALQLRHELGWASTMFNKTCVDNSAHTFACDDYKDYIKPDAHRIIASLTGIEAGSLLTCTWLTAPKGGSSTRGEAVTQPCKDTVTLDIPYPKGAAISVEIGGREVLRSDILVRDLLVVGMGDSFASGEGNPDIPVRFSRDRTADYGTIGLGGEYSGYPARMGEWRSIGDRAFIRENARWIDQACHRSLYSHQMRAALQLGIEDPHRAVTYVGLACSGAEVIDGMFLRYKGNEWVPNPPTLSQISAAAEAQCGNSKAQAQDFPEAYHLNGRIPELKGGLVLRRCATEEARKIDLLFLSIGGNDIGFSRLVANAVLSSGSTLRMLGGWLGEVHGQAEAEAAMSRLDIRYKALDRALHNILLIPWNESDRIILTSYPGMALIGDGSEICDDGKAGLEVVPDFELSKVKLRESTWIADKLHRMMRDNAEKAGWTFAESHRRNFIERGICSGGTHDGGNPADDLRLPRKIEGVWVPYNPADYKAYAERQRWFRTPNDAFMTGNFHVAASLLEKVLKLQGLSWFQLLLASTYSGAFHPTAEGQAAMADSVADKARIVLEKYGQGPEPVFNEPDFVPPPPVAEPGPVPSFPPVAGTDPAAGDAFKPSQDGKQRVIQGDTIDPSTAGLPANTPFLVRPDSPAAEHSPGTSGSETFRAPISEEPGSQSGSGARPDMKAPLTTEPDETPELPLIDGGPIRHGASSSTAP